MSSYNLLEEKWIDCIDLQGENRTLSLSDLILDAHHIHSLAGEFPIINTSILFMLNALLISVFRKQGVALSDGRVWIDLFNAGRFEEGPFLDYFQSWRHRFNLFDDELPFFQTLIPEEKEGQFTGTAMKLMPHYTGGTGGNSATLFDHHTLEEGIALTPKRAAQFLLPAHYYGAGGRIMGRDYFNVAFAAKGLVFFLQGENLFETLMLNLLPYPDIDDVNSGPADCPIWERDTPYEINGRPGVNEGKNILYIPFGLMDILTWPGRKIQLIKDEDGLVRNIRMRLGLNIKQDYFPWFAYNRKGNFIRAREGQLLWRDYDVLLQFRQMNAVDSMNRSPQAVDWLNENIDDLDERVFNFYGAGMAKEAIEQKVHFYAETYFPLPTALLGNNDCIIEISYCLEKAEAIQGKLHDAVSRLTTQNQTFTSDQFEDRKNEDNVKNLINYFNVESVYWEALEPNFYGLILHLPHDPVESMRRWEEAVQSAARSALAYAIRLAGESIAVWKASSHANAVLEKGLKGILTLIRKGSNHE